MEAQEITSLITFTKGNLSTGKDFQTRCFNKYQTEENILTPREIIRFIKDKNPVMINDHIIIGYDSTGFIDHNNNVVKIDKPVPAIAVIKKIETNESPEDSDSEQFLILGSKSPEWENVLDPEFMSVLSQRKISEPFMPSRSAILNFSSEDNDELSSSIGANINIFDKRDYISAILFEIGKLYWNTRLSLEDKNTFEKEVFTRFRSALIENDRDIAGLENYFATLYRWKMKSVLFNKAIRSIIEHEDPEGLRFIENAFSEVAKEGERSDLWDLSKESVIEYLNPKFDSVTNRYIRKKGLIDSIRDIELPENVLNNIHSVQDGTTFISLKKSMNPVPVNGRKIVFEKIVKPGEKFTPLEKSRSLTNGKPIIFVDMDGVVADFKGGYVSQFNRDCEEDDIFTIRNFIKWHSPRFFRYLPVLQKGKELVDKLSEKYTIVFLTTPMDSIPFCKKDKIDWAKDNFPEIKTILFSNKKEEYAGSERAVLIDDMNHNLIPFRENGGTAIDSALDNDRILELVDQAFSQDEVVASMKKQVSNLDTNTEPTQQQKESGQYKKGKIVFKGMNISIENPKGSIRFGFDEKGKKWVTKLKNHYGYINNAPEGNDGDKIDCFIGDKYNGNKVFVVNQRNVSSGLFDEHKVMLCFSNIEEAEKAYLSNYEKDWNGIMSIVPTNTKAFRKWLNEGNKTEPFGSKSEQEVEPVKPERDYGSRLNFWNKIRSLGSR